MAKRIHHCFNYPQTLSNYSMAIHVILIMCKYVEVYGMHVILLWYVHALVCTYTLATMRVHDYVYSYLISVVSYESVELYHITGNFRGWSILTTSWV